MSNNRSNEIDCKDFCADDLTSIIVGAGDTAHNLDNESNNINATTDRFDYVLYVGHHLADWKHNP